MMSERDRLAQIASAMVRFRRTRFELLPAELFSEPAWDMLLILFVADSEGERMTGRKVCEQTGTADTIMSSWMKHLSSIGFIVGDGSGDLDDPLTLSGEAFEKMERVMTEATVLREAISN